MSLAYLRSNALTELANCGPSASDKVEKALGDLLGEAPGPWMPDDVASTLELVERAYRNAEKGGKDVIVLSLRRIILDLGRAWLKRPLKLSESRQLLGAMELSVAWQGTSRQLDLQVARLLWTCKNAQALFSSRVLSIPEIVGDNKSGLSSFVDSLWEKLPETKRNKTEQFFAKRRAVFTRSKKNFFKWATKISGEPYIEFFRKRFDGEPVVIQLEAGHQKHLVGVCPIPTGDKAFEVAKDISELETFFKRIGHFPRRIEHLVLDAGGMEIDNSNRLNLIEGANARVRRRWSELMDKSISDRNANPAQTGRVASIWRRILGQKHELVEDIKRFGDKTFSSSESSLIDRETEELVGQD